MINDQGVTPGEYNQAVNNLEKRGDLLKYIEAVITVNGHAWCMDVKAERKKMARLFVEIIESIKTPVKESL